MSCGNPHATSCQDVLARLDAFLDHEHDALAGFSAHDIQHHLEECPPCLRHFGMQQMVRALVQRSCGCHGGGCDCGCTPSMELRMRIMSHITQITASGYVTQIHHEQSVMDYRPGVVPPDTRGIL